MNEVDLDDGASPSQLGRRFLVEDWAARDRANLSARAYNSLLRMVEGKQGTILPRCRTLGDVADLRAAQVLTIPNCSWGTVQALAESLGRAGIAVRWERC